MDTLERWSRKIDRMDENMIALFEQRMAIVKRSAEYRKRHGLKADNGRNDSDIVDKVTRSSCDAEVIEYTEGLIMYLQNTSKEYQRSIMKRK